MKTNTFIVLGPHLEQIGPIYLTKRDMGNEDVALGICEQVMAEFLIGERDVIPGTPTTEECLKEETANEQRD